MMAMMMASAGASNQPQPVVDAGVEYGGGYYAGADIVVDGVQYLVIVAPKSQGQSSSTLQWKTSMTSSSGSFSRNNGRANTAEVIATDAAAHTAANFCNSLTINGHSDWHLPSEDELEVCYRYLKPTTRDNDTSGRANLYSVPPTGIYTSSDPSQTSVSIFRSGGEESFDEAAYWSSTQNTATRAWRQSFSSGAKREANKTDTYHVRAVRWEKRL